MGSVRHRFPPRDPSDLFDVRRDGKVPACGDNWLIVDSRNVFYDPPIVDEGDVEAFVVLTTGAATWMP